MKRLKRFLSILTIVLVSASFCQAAIVTKINQSKGQISISEGKDAGFVFGSKVCFLSISNDRMICGRVLRTTESYSIVRIRNSRETKEIKMGSKAVLYIEEDKTAMTVRESLQGKIETAIGILRNDLDQQEKNKQIVEVVMPMFNFPLMAKLTLGKKYWPDLTTRDQKKFTELFTQRLKEFYLNKLNNYTNEKVVFMKAKRAKNKVKVPTQLIGKGDPVTILYKFYKSKDEWLIYDVEIQGVSIISTYRSQFAQVLREGTVNDLLVKLEENK